MSDNPFSQQAQSGQAFQDPSVQAAQSTGPDGAPMNPFLGNDSPGFGGNQVTMGFPGDGGQQFPGEAGGGFGGASGGDNKSLDERERRLNDWEKSLQQREQALKDGEPVSNNNWPPCYPVIRSDIKEDFTDSFDEELKAQGWIVLWAYRLMLVNFVALLWNLVCYSAYASTGSTDNEKNENKFAAVGLAICYLVFGVPGAIYMWYRVIYIACQTKRASMYFIAIAVFAIHTIWWIVAACGFPGTYLAGFWIAMVQFGYADSNDVPDDDKGGYYVTGWMMLAGFVIATGVAFASCFLLFHLRKLYQNSGGGDAAKQQAAQDIGSNPHVQQAAMEGAVAGAGAGFGGARK